MQVRDLTLALKPRVEITRTQNLGYQCPNKNPKHLKNGFTFLTDYCPINPELICLPRLYINFDNGLVLENHGIEFVASMVSKHICCVRCLTLEMSKNICLYCVFNPRMNYKLYFYYQTERIFYLKPVNFDIMAHWKHLSNYPVKLTTIRNLK